MEKFKLIQLSEDDYQKIINDDFTEIFWENELESVCAYEDLVKISPFVEHTMRICPVKKWVDIKVSIREFICEEGVPSKLIKSFLDGDLKDIITALLSVFMAKFHVALSVLIPIVALVIKTGVYKFCEV